MLSPSHQKCSSLSISCPCPHRGVIFKGTSVSSGVCQRGMCRQGGGGGQAQPCRQGQAAAERQAGDGQGAGQGASTACVLRHEAWVPPCPAPHPPGPAWGLMYLQDSVHSFGAIEKMGGSALQADGMG